MNKLEDSLRNESKLEKFKTGMKKWSRENIKTKPTSKYPKITFRNPVQQHPTPQVEANPNDIRQFLVPLAPPPPTDRPPPPTRPQPTDRPPTTTTQSVNRITRYFTPAQGTGTRSISNNN
jgi:hypothetical protein